MDAWQPLSDHCQKVPEPQKYVEYVPFGQFLGVWGYYFAYFWVPGINNQEDEGGAPNTQSLGPPSKLNSHPSSKNLRPKPLNPKPCTSL